MPPATPKPLPLILASGSSYRRILLEKIGLHPHCDQCAELDGQILGKPGTRARAQNQLSKCSGREVLFHTGICLLNSQTGKQHISVETVTVAFRTLNSLEIERYTEREPALDCAGSFKAEGLGISLFRHIHSDDPNTLIGLPLIRLIDFLKEEDYPLL